MTIDEAISQEKEMAEIHRNNIVQKEDYHNMPWIDKNNEASMRCAEYHEKIAGWLEDYKRIKMLIPIEQALKAEYNKAVDDLVNRMLEEGIIGLVQYAKIKEIAEQLKAGGENDN